MRIISVSIPYPGPGRRFSGLFVQRRLSALAARGDLSVISPRPWFPWLSPAAYTEAVGAGRAAVIFGQTLVVMLKGLLTKYLKSPSRRSHQRSVGQVVVRVVKAADYVAENDARIIREIRRRLGEGIRVVIVAVDRLPVEVSGKYRHVTSDVDWRGTTRGTITCEDRSTIPAG